MQQQLSIREIQTEDLEPLVQYWITATPEYLAGMGADFHKLPPKTQLHQQLGKQIGTPYAQKTAYALIWLVDGQASGHCNVNQIQFGEQANMHLHLWQSARRQKGLGAAFIRLALPYFFENLQLKRLICEPYSLNPAPNKTLAKLGFTFEKSYLTTPGPINFEQTVNRWILSQADYQLMRSSTH